MKGKEKNKEERERRRKVGENLFNRKMFEKIEKLNFEVASQEAKHFPP